MPTDQTITLLLNLTNGDWGKDGFTLLFPLFSSSNALGLGVPPPPLAREGAANVQFTTDHPITTQTKLNWPNDVLPKLPSAPSPPIKATSEEQECKIKGPGQNGDAL